VADIKNVLRLRKVDLYFRFVVDEELFSTISESVEQLPIYGRNYFSNVLQRIGDFLWRPRTNQVQINLFQRRDIIEIDLRFLSARIYFGFSDKIAHSKRQMTEGEFFDEIQHIFHPIDEYIKRLKFSFKQWKSFNKNFKQPIHYQPSFYPFPICTLDWSFCANPIDRIDFDCCIRDRFCDTSLDYLLGNLQQNCSSDFYMMTDRLMSDSDLFTSLMKNQHTQLSKYYTIYDYYPHLATFFNR
jgi:hypothetical protein